MIYFVARLQWYIGVVQKELSHFVKEDALKYE